MSHLDSCIARAPDPQAAEIRLERMRQDREIRRQIDMLAPPELEKFVAVVSISHFLHRTLCRHPEFIPLTGSRPLEPGAPPGQCRNITDLRLLKYRELYRIACLDIGGAGDYVYILRALSWLAEAVVNGALALANGDPKALWIWKDALCVIALGKLGACELNFSSDLDLIFVSSDHPAHGHDIGPFQERLFDSVRALSRQLEDGSDNGFLYRVDLNLRPWGRSGPLFMSVDGTEHYYEASADVWERYAWLRARPLAGAMTLGRDLLQRLRPFRFARSLGSRDLERFIDIKQEMGRARMRRGHWNVKVGDGGIRDIEYFVQTLQLLNAARHECLQTTNTLEALQALAGTGLVSAGQGQAIRNAYLFLRRLENRLQMVDEQQTHELPDDPARRAVLARSFGIAATGNEILERFESDLAVAQSVARDCFDRILPDRGVGPARREMDPKAALREAWRPAAAESSLERWRQVCAMEDWGPVPRDLATLVRVFGSSWYLTRFMFFRGAEAAQLLDTPPATGLSQDDLRRWAESLPRAGEPEEQLERVRIARNEVLLLLLAAWLNGRLDQEQLEQALSSLAEAVLQAAVRLFGLDADSGGAGFAVLAMGRLAGREMTFGSDLDLIFMYHAEECREPVELSRRVRRLLRHIAAATPAGALYDVDMRLRPHGSAGALLTSVQSFEQYHQAPRDIWERQMMTRCRPVYEMNGVGMAALAAILPCIFYVHDGGHLRR